MMPLAFPSFRLKFNIVQGNFLTQGSISNCKLQLKFTKLKVQPDIRPNRKMMTGRVMDIIGHSL